MVEVASLLERYRRGDRLALARLLTLVSRGEALAEIAAGTAGYPSPAVVEPLPSAPSPKRGEESSSEPLPEAGRGGRGVPLVVAITGAGGVGKSTLVGKLIDTIRTTGQRVAVLACDPESSLSHGALLGDRFRMPSRAGDDGVYIRSLATPAGRGAVAAHLELMVRLLAGFGFAVVLIETVGAGQGEYRVAELADVLVLLLQPEAGDDLQWEKAGVFELADLIVVNKADLPGADQIAAQVRRSIELGMPRQQQPDVLLVSGRTGQGVDRLWEQVQGFTPRQQPAAVEELLELAQAHLQTAFQQVQHTAAFTTLVGRWQRGELSPAKAAEAVLQLALAGSPG